MDTSKVLNLVVAISAITILYSNTQQFSMLVPIILLFVFIYLIMMNKPPSILTMFSIPKPKKNSEDEDDSDDSDDDNGDDNENSNKENFKDCKET